MKYYKMLLVMLLALTMISCTEKVPPGYNGMVNTPEGLTGEVLDPGNRTCWGRDRMVMWEKLELAQTEQLKILCKDDLNFAFDLKIRSTIDASNNDKIMYVLDKMGSKIVWDGDMGILPYQTIYNTYVKDPARSIARGIVSQYETTQIRENREEIVAKIKKEVITAVQGSPVKITFISASNFDYPDVITNAMEAKRKREIEIGEEKAKQAMELLRMDNRQALAEKEKVVKMKEAEKDAVYMSILGKVITPEYLKLREIERDIILYGKVGAGDKVIVTNGNSVSPFVDTRSTTK